MSILTILSDNFTAILFFLCTFVCVFSKSRSRDAFVLYSMYVTLLNIPSPLFMVHLNELLPFKAIVFVFIGVNQDMYYKRSIVRWDFTIPLLLVLIFLNSYQAFNLVERTNFIFPTLVTIYSPLIHAVFVDVICVCCVIMYTNARVRFAVIFQTVLSFYQLAINDYIGSQLSTLWEKIGSNGTIPDQVLMIAASAHEHAKVVVNLPWLAILTCSLFIWLTMTDMPRGIKVVRLDELRTNKSKPKKDV